LKLSARPATSRTCRAHRSHRFIVECRIAGPSFPRGGPASTPLPTSSRARRASFASSPGATARARRFLTAFGLVSRSTLRTMARSDATVTARNSHESAPEPRARAMAHDCGRGDAARSLGCGPRCAGRPSDHDNAGMGISKMALSFTLDLGCKYGGGVHCSHGPQRGELLRRDALQPRVVRSRPVRGDARRRLHEQFPAATWCCCRR